MPNHWTARELAEFKIFLSFSKDFSVDMCYLDMHCLICKNLKIFQLSVTDFYFNPIVVSEQPVFYSFKSVKLCFYGPAHGPASEEYVMYCCGTKTRDVSDTQVTDGTIELEDILTAFLPTGSVHFR